MKRTYVLTLNDGPDDSALYVLQAAQIFDFAARSLRAEAAGGTVVSHERECYGTQHGTLEYVLESQA